MFITNQGHGRVFLGRSPRLGLSERMIWQRKTPTSHYFVEESMTQPHSFLLMRASKLATSRRLMPINWLRITVSNKTSQKGSSALLPQDLKVMVKSVFSQKYLLQTVSRKVALRKCASSENRKTCSANLQSKRSESNSRRLPRSRTRNSS